MAISSEPAAELSQLTKADGSTTFIYQGYAVTAAVNGPVEAQRRDEQAFEALVDVNVRPAAGVGGTAERQLESILQSALRQLIPIRSYPRSVFQVTLQIVETPENAYENAKIGQAQLNLSLIPALLHAAVLGLLTAATPLKTIATATTLSISNQDGEDITVEPTTHEISQAKSVHVLAFTSKGDLLLTESHGSFSVEEWKKALKLGEQICCQERSRDGDTVMDGDELKTSSIRDFIRSVMETKVGKDLYWK